MVKPVKARQRTRAWQGTVATGKITRTCSKCSAGPGQSCRRIVGASTEAPYTVRLKNFHEER